MPSSSGCAMPMCGTRGRRPREGRERHAAPATVHAAVAPALLGASVLSVPPVLRTASRCRGSVCRAGHVPPPWPHAPVRKTPLKPFPSIAGIRQCFSNTL